MVQPGHFLPIVLEEPAIFTPNKKYGEGWQIAKWVSAAVGTIFGVLGIMFAAHGVNMMLATHVFAPISVLQVSAGALLLGVGAPFLIMLALLSDRFMHHHWPKK